MEAVCEDQHPIVVYGLADVPLVLREHIPPDSPLHRCGFFSAVVGPTIEVALETAFALEPEPPCDERDIAEGMRIAEAVGTALKTTSVGLVLFASRCHEEAKKAQWGFHAGTAAAFRRALERAGLTLVEGAEVFRDLLRFVVTDVPLVKRVTDGQTLWFTEVPTIMPLTNGGTPLLSAVMNPPPGWQAALVGMDGGVVELPAAPVDAPPLRLPAAPEGPLDHATDLSPAWASARLGTHPVDGDEAEALLRTMLERAVERSSDEVLATAREWVDYLLSDRVTGRMGRFGEALLTGLSAILGEAEVQRLVADLSGPH